MDISAANDCRDCPLVPNPHQINKEMRVNKEKEGCRRNGAGGGGEGRLTGFIPFFFPPLPRPLSFFIAFLPFLSGLFGFDSGQMVKLCESDREFY